MQIRISAVMTLGYICEALVINCITYIEKSLTIWDSNIRCVNNFDGDLCGNGLKWN